MPPAPEDCTTATGSSLGCDPCGSPQGSADEPQGGTFLGVVTQIGAHPCLHIEGIGEVRFAYRNVKKLPGESKPFVSVGECVTCRLARTNPPKAVSVRIVKRRRDGTLGPGREPSDQDVPLPMQFTPSDDSSIAPPVIPLPEGPLLRRAVPTQSPPPACAAVPRTPPPRAAAADAFFNPFNSPSSLTITAPFSL